MVQILLSFSILIFAISLINFLTIRIPQRDEEVKKAVTVLAPMRNEAENVPEFISALSSQMGVKNLKFIVINDGSTDKTAQLLNTVIGSDSRFTVIDSPAQREGWLGKVSALQSGFDVATSDYIITLDADVRLEPNAIMRAITQLERLINSNDCNDANGSVYPGATEICNSMDDNCNNQTDEGVQTVYFIDNDGDNYGNASAAILGCVQPAGYTADNNDCNDTNAAINPGSIEVLGNGIDENCDGQIDNSIAELIANIALYPNPTRSDLNIQVDGTLIGNEMYIFDLVGNLVYKQQLLSTQTTVSVSNLVNGNYIVRVGELVKRFEVIK